MVVDTLRERPAAARLLARAHADGRPYVCVVTIEEVWRGARPSEHERIRVLFDGLRLAPLRREQAELAGRWRRDFAARGITLGQADCLIAAAAVGVGARLATGNPKDFPMRELVVEHWPAGA